MLRSEELKEIINKLNKELAPLEKELRDIRIKESNECELKIDRAHKLEYKFEPNELVFASTSRCICGAGFCYPKNGTIQGSWYCSNIMLGIAEKFTSHSEALPFSFYSIKSENQPSAGGLTTRPDK